LRRRDNRGDTDLIKKIQRFHAFLQANSVKCKHGNPGFTSKPLP
jgi:hypothetical protein